MEVVFLGSVCDEAGIFIIQKKSTSGLDRGRSGTLQRDSNNVPVTGQDICSDFAEINNRVSSQTVMMTSGMLESSPSWEGGTTTPGDWYIDAAAADSTVWTRMWQNLQYVTFIRGHAKRLCARPQQKRVHRFGQEEP